MSEVLGKFSCDHIPEGDSCGLVATLVKQNAKLRKLAKDMHTLATDHDVYVRYSYCHAWDEKLAVVEKQMSELGIEVESIALCLSEEGGYEYYDIDDDLKELAKNVSDMEAENSKLRKLAAQMGNMLDCVLCDHRLGCNWRDDGPCWYEIELRKLGVEVDG